MTSDHPSEDRTTSERTVFGVRISQAVQDDFAAWVEENHENSRGALGRAAERALIEFMDNDRYARLSQRLSDLEETTNHTHAMVRQLVTAEKEKGAFLEPAPMGNQAGDRTSREDAVLRELATRVADGEHGREFSESELNAVIAEVAGVSSAPTRRDYRESLVDRGLLGVRLGQFRVSDAGFEHAGFELRREA